jgi:hypothetical protein
MEGLPVGVGLIFKENTKTGGVATQAFENSIIIHGYNCIYTQVSFFFFNS